VAREPNAGDLAFRWTTALFALGALATLVVLGLELVRESAPSLSRFGARFVVDTTWDPVHERFGALPFLYGTLVSSLLALVIAVPVGLGVAIFLAELAPPRLRAPAGFLVELLAAVPSVVYGMWGLFVLAPWLRTSVEPLLARTLGFLPFFRGPPQGVGMLAGGLILSVMILPTISAVSREVLAAVPASLREGALALGATRWEAIRFAVLPTARTGIFGAAVLGLGRALGETMAVTMVIGNRPEISASLFAPGYTMASVLANEFTEATGDLYLAALTEVALLLFAVTLLLNLVARLLVRRTRAASGMGRI
jgi:phosphate transport system permease protein